MYVPLDLTFSTAAFANSVFVGFPCFLKEAATISLNYINHLIFEECNIAVFFEVGTECVNTICVSFEGLKYKLHFLLCICLRMLVLQAQVCLSRFLVEWIRLLLYFSFYIKNNFSSIESWEMRLIWSNFLMLNYF